MSIAACAEIVRKSDRDRFLATMAAPVWAREKLFPLYAFNIEVSRAPWVTGEPLIAEMRLQWWRDVLSEIADGRVVRSHEVSTPLADVLTPEGARALAPLIDARSWDIAGQGFADGASLGGHIENTGALLATTAAHVLGAPSKAAGHVGFAQGVAAWFRAVPALKAAGKHPLPGDPIETIRTLAKAGLDRYLASRRLDVPAAAHPALLVGFDAPLVLKTALNEPIRVLEGRVAPSEIRRRFRLMRQAAFKQW